MKTVAIIGGGFCGMMTAVQIIRELKLPAEIVIINAGRPFGKGTAYSTYSEEHLLNVVASQMSAFPDDPDHFLNWIDHNGLVPGTDKAFLTDRYFPRRWYGDYLLHIWNETISRKFPGIEVSFISDWATDIIPIQSGYSVLLDQGTQVVADTIVLATGNALPGNVLSAESTSLLGPDYIPDPWSESVVTDVDLDKDVLIIGNGLTMADTVLGLSQRGFRAKIHTLSPHGFHLRRHYNCATDFSSMVNELNGQVNLLHIIKVLNRYKRQAQYSDRCIDNLVSTLRQEVPRLWTQLSMNEKERFYNRLNPLWNSARHRLPGSVYYFLLDQQERGRLEFHRGQVCAINGKNGNWDIAIGNPLYPTTISVCAVINCSGPEIRVNMSGKGLLNQLYRSGLVSQGPLGFGIKADLSDLTVIDRKGLRQENLYVLGTGLKGMLWESTAVPELRMQVQLIARNVVQSIQKNKRIGIFRNFFG